MAAEPPEAHSRPDEMRNGNRGDRELRVHVPGEHRRHQAANSKSRNRPDDAAGDRGKEDETLHHHAMVCCAARTMPIRTFAAVAAACLGLTSACSRAVDPAEWTMTVQRVAAPSGINSSEPQFVASPGGVVLSWVEREGKTTYLKYAERAG